MKNCSQCSKKFKNGDCKIGCELCGKWFHISCNDVTEELWKAITESEQCHWFCQKCNQNAPEILSIARKAVKEIAENKSKIEAVQKDVKTIIDGTNPGFTETIKRIVVDTIKDETDPSFKETVKKLVLETNQENNVNGGQRNTKETVRKIAIREIQENNDKKGRECNVVVSGLDEEIDAEEEIPNILSKLDVTVEVEGIRRMGKDKEEGKTRLVWVKLGNKKQRNMVLENAKKLKREEQWKKVYINKDMTDEERKQAYLLRKELRERRNQEERDSGNRKFVIHRGRVVEKEENDREPSDDGISESD